MKILVPIDGSKYTDMCLKVASFLSKGRDVEIYILNVIPNISDIDLELSPSDHDAIRESFARRGESLLDKAKQVFESYGNKNITTVLLRGASPAREIIDYAKQEKIDLVVIGSRGITEEARFFLGGVTKAVVEHSPCCVFVVKESCVEYCSP